MRKILATVVSLAFTVAYLPGVSSAQSPCPAEVETAKVMLKQKQTAARVPASGKEVQAPRTLAGARTDQQLQAPRSGDQQIQAPRTLAGARSTMSSADFKKAASLVKEAEMACTSGNMTVASEKAKSAMELMK
ncbi:MAG TPA: hypothetical protein VMT79_05635 [Candidatus Binatia bacterium]|nr:hypothetical protein [Candidatus Binatia bacterium]